MLYKRNGGTVRVNTMTIIENLPTFNADLPNNLFSRLPIRDNKLLYHLWLVQVLELYVTTRLEEIIDARQDENSVNWLW